jgi:hypothetical protein
VFSKDFDPVAHVRARRAERRYAKHAPAFALTNSTGRVRLCERDVERWIAAAREQGFNV